MDMEPSDEMGLTSYGTLKTSETMNHPVKFEKVALACGVKRSEKATRILEVSPSVCIISSVNCIDFNKCSTRFGEY